MTLVLPLPPAVDAFTRRAIRYRALHAVACGERTIVLDAAGTSSVDPLGVDTLVSVQRAVRAFGGRMVLAGVAEPVRAALALAGADQVLEVAPTVEAARAATSQAVPMADGREAQRRYPRPDDVPAPRGSRGRYAAAVARLANAADCAEAAMAIVDRAARDGGPAVLPHHEWTAMGGRHQVLLLQRAQLLGVTVAVTLPTDGGGAGVELPFEQVTELRVAPSSPNDDSVIAESTPAYADRTSTRPTPRAGPRDRPATT